MKAEDARAILLAVIDKKKEDEPLYVHVPSFSKKYEIVIFSWMKGYEFKKRGDFLVYDKKGGSDLINPKKGLNDKIKEEGLPIVLGEIINGLASRERMLYSISEKSDWIVDKKERMILGSMKVSFVANYCHYQVRGNVSIWKLYNFLKVKSMDYLKHHRIEHVDDFMGYMRIRRYDISCHKIVNTGLTFLNPDTGRKSTVCDAEFAVDKKGIETIKNTLAGIVKMEKK